MKKSGNDEKNRKKCNWVKEYVTDMREKKEEGGEEEEEEEEEENKRKTTFCFKEFLTNKRRKLVRRYGGPHHI